MKTITPLVALLALALPAQAEETVEVAASSRYNAGRVHRFVLGGGYRDVWAQPIKLPVLDLGKVGGGLTPTKRFGGLQTAVLGFKGADGRLYSFRGTDKDPSAILDPVLRETVFRNIVQDQMAAQHPAGPLVAGVLTKAAGVITIPERMVVMPDDPRLGDFREEFAGMVGNFYEYPTPKKGDYEGLYGATKIISQKKLFPGLKAGTLEVDRKAFLRARLLDIFLGDFDRHRNQFRWAKRPGSDLWQPIPEDRDQAFVRYDGFGQRFGYLFVPILQNYGDDYPWMRGLVLHGWEQDRHLLAPLSWAEWEAIAKDVQSKLTDDVIEQALAAQPKAYQDLDAERLRRDIRGRRDKLLEGARAFYEHLADRVDIRATQKTENVSIQRFDGGDVEVKITVGAQQTFFRRFDADDTSEIRIYLEEGDDQVKIDGDDTSICIRIIAESGDKTIDDAPGGHSQIYASSPETKVLGGSGTHVDRRPYQLPPSDAGFVDIEDVPPRDWGSETFPFILFGYAPDIGALFGAAGLHERYGFRKHPFASRHRLTAAYGTAAQRPRVHYTGQFRFENSDLESSIDILLSGLELVRFHGFGNETPRQDDLDRTRSRNVVYRIEPAAMLPALDDLLKVRLGLWAQYVVTAQGDRLIDDVQPYGSGDFGSTGLFLDVQLDTRKSITGLKKDLALPFGDNVAAGYPTSGFLVQVRGEVGPRIWDVESAWGAVEGSAAGFLAFGDRGRFAGGLRLGGRHTMGRTPYLRAAYLGGGNVTGGITTLRGFRAQRFAGDTAVYGNLDLRMMLFRAKLIVPGEFGLFAFGDVGRVFEDEPTAGPADSDRWHPSAGGGIWWAPLARTNTFTLSAAHSRDETVLIYLRAGFHF